MTIWKSILITAFLVITSTALGLLIFQFDNDSILFPYIVGLSYIIPDLLTYAIALTYLKYSKDNFSLSEPSPTLNARTVFFLIIALMFGRHLLNLPFNEWKNLSNIYLGTTYSISDYSYYKFNPLQLYRAFSALILAPIFEEVVFRYYIFGGLLKRHTLWTAILISSILFSLIHIGNPISLVPTFIFGVISALIYFRTQKLFFSILLHFVANCIWFLTVIFAKEYSQVIKQIGFGGLFWTIFLIGVLIIILGLKKIIPQR